MAIIKLSPKQHKVATQYGLKDEELAFADLLAAGWTPADAWSMIFRVGGAWSKEQIKRERELLTNKEGVQQRIADRQHILRKSQVEKVEKEKEKEINSDRKSLLARATSKEDKLIELQSALDGFAIGSPEWIKTNQMIIDVSRMKQDDVKEEDTTVHYYLPINYPTSCDNCLIGLKKKKADKLAESEK